MSNFTDGYIDIRLHVTLETETFETAGESYSHRFLVDASPEVIDWQSIEDHELQVIGSALQMARHQEMLANDIPNEIYNIIPEDPFEE